MNIPNEEYLARKIKYYGGLNFKTKFDLSTVEYWYLREKYNIKKLLPRNQRLCWKCDNNHISKDIKNTTMCTKCFEQHAQEYKKTHPANLISMVDKVIKMGIK